MKVPLPFVYCVLLGAGISVVVTARKEEEEDMPGECGTTWDLHGDDHLCNIGIWTLDEFDATMVSHDDDDAHGKYYDRPFILRDPTFRRNVDFVNRAHPRNVHELFSSETVSLPFANLFSMANNTVTVQDYVRRLPEIKSTDRADEVLYMLTSLDELSHYHPPPSSLVSAGASVSDKRFGVGGLGSGAQWHMHGPGWCHVFWGRKHWLLTKPAETAPDFNRTHPSRHWMDHYYNNYHSVINDDDIDEERNEKLWQCTVEPGDAIYFPNRWWHMTVNLANYTAFVTTFYET